MDIKGMIGKIDLKGAIVKYVLIGIVSLVVGFLIHFWKEKEGTSSEEE